MSDDPEESMDTGTFSVFTVGEKPIAPSFDASGNPVRKRQQHRKSRNGCGNCKQRRVKCDESLPSCVNCTRRNLKCNPAISSIRTGKSEKPLAAQPEIEDQPVRSKSAEALPSLSSVLEQSIAIDFESNDSWSQDDKALFRHFRDFTSHTLAMHTDLWRTFMLSSALNDEYLKSAVLLLSSAHINSSLPKKDPTRRPVLNHFANAVSGLRAALNERITAQSFDSIVGCSFLLVHYSWAAEESDPHVTHHFHEIVGLINGTKNCVVEGQDLLQGSALYEVFRHRPGLKLEKFIEESPMRGSTRTSALFNHCMMCGLGTKGVSGASPDNTHAIQKLVTVLRAIELSQPNVEVTPVLHDIIRYLFTWPLQCTKGFMEHIDAQEPASMTALLYYYAAAASVSLGRVWWMQDRARVIYAFLKASLVGRCAECTNPAIALAEGRL
ncbi:hypothetical protein ONS95_002614 [Cadophora gregata]|uniref:uncharacterized protein n=1 Tax=Cadophora gregata TaxID=51156 RepID=UPI0026DC2A6A|nr:uncharacterized protein ONS95_002614 [Cadophora gregata]KAK0109947.1 hypothetical protein ONS95_002614 [Cadophora gregata]KAK0110425.1 hypothetical protein ONS96_002037 [Cadophora gregata f. sp. sojae]